MFNSQKGISLYITVIIMSIILASVLGLSAFLVSQIRMIRSISYSVIALFAADTGVEVALGDIYGGVYSSPYSSLPGEFESNNGSVPAYTVKICCCDKTVNGQCIIDPLGPETCFFPQDATCSATCFAKRYCIRSVGNYRGVKRAIEAKIN